MASYKDLLCMWLGGHSFGKFPREVRPSVFSGAKQHVMSLSGELKVRVEPEEVVFLTCSG